MKSLITKIGAHPFINDRPAVKQFMKFGIVGVINTILDYALYTLFVTIFDVHYLIANVLSFSIAVTNSFLLNRKWTFRQSGTNWRHEALKYAMVYASGLGIGEAMLYVFVGRMHLHELVGKAMIVAIVLFWNYVGIRFWAFRRPHQLT